MQTTIIVICTLLGVLVGGRQFRLFPWKEKPPTWVFVSLMLVYFVIGGLLGYLIGGWLAGYLA